MMLLLIILHDAMSPCVLHLVCKRLRDYFCSNESG